MISLSDVFKLNRSHEAVGWYLEYYACTVYLFSDLFVYVCSIKTSSESQAGVYIVGITPNSVAHNAGLKV